MTLLVIPVAIIGNGAAAAEAVRALREHGYAGEIHLFADNDHGPYNPMLGTYVVSGAIPSERAFPFGAGWTFYDSYGVTAHLGTAVTALDPGAQSFSTADGSSYEYERCLLATGARPSLPPITGLREAVASPSAPVFTIQILRRRAGSQAGGRRPSRRRRSRRSSTRCRGRRFLRGGEGRRGSARIGHEGRADRAGIVHVAPLRPSLVRSTPREPPS